MRELLDDIDRWRGAGKRVADRPRRRRRGLGAAWSRRGDGGQRGRRGRRQRQRRLRRGGRGHRGAGRARRRGRAAGRHVRLLRRRGVRRRPDVRRDDPPVRRAARTGERTSHAARCTRRLGERAIRAERRSPSPPWSTAPASAPSCSSRPARPPIGTLGDPELDRVVGARRAGRARGGPVRCAPLRPARRDDPRGPRRLADRRGVRRQSTRRRRRCGSSVPSTSPPRWPRSPSCSATASPCAMPARCSPPGGGSRWPTRWSCRGRHRCSTSAGRALGRPRRRVHPHPRPQVRRAGRDRRARHERRLHRRDGQPDDARQAARPPRRGRRHRPGSARPADVTDRARHRRPHAGGDGDLICAEIIANAYEQARPPASATTQARSTGPIADVRCGFDVGGVAVAEAGGAAR